MTASRPLRPASTSRTSSPSSRLASGVYYENVTIGKSVTIDGVDSSSSTIDGSVLPRVITIPLGNDVTLAHLTVRNGYRTFDGSGVGILNDGRLTVFKSVMQLANVDAVEARRRLRRVYGFVREALGAGT